MALPIFQRTVTDSKGNIVAGATVTVKSESTGLAASIFSDRAGSAALSNPFNTGADGLASFYAAPGEYRIEVASGAFSLTWRYQVLEGDIATKAVVDFPVKVASVSGLANANLVEGQAVELIGYHPDTTVGGGSGVVKTARHNGGTAISLTRSRPVDWSGDLTAWFADSGENELCFVRTSTVVSADMFGLDLGANQANLESFREKFTSRKNPSAVFPGIIGINNPDCGSVFDLASFGGQGISGFNPIGFVFHHYSNSRMIQMDNVGSNNEILYLKNANNPVRRSDQPSDFIGSAKFISLNRQESDGGGGVTGTLEGFYFSKDFEMVWPMQATGINTVRLWNNISAASGFWTHELKNTNEQQFLLRVDNGGTTPFSVEYFAPATNTQIKAHKSMQLQALDGTLFLKSSGIIRSDVPHRLQNYASGTLPTLTVGDRGCMAYVDDGAGAGNRFPAHWDGSAWLKVSDNTSA